MATSDDHWRGSRSRWRYTVGSRWGQRARRTGRVPCLGQEARHRPDPAVPRCEANSSVAAPQRWESAREPVPGSTGVEGQTQSRCDRLGSAPLGAGGQRCELRGAGFSRPHYQVRKVPIAPALGRCPQASHAWVSPWAQKWDGMCQRAARQSLRDRLQRASDRLGGNIEEHLSCEVGAGSAAQYLLIIAWYRMQRGWGSSRVPGLPGRRRAVPQGPSGLNQ